MITSNFLFTLREALRGVCVRGEREERERERRERESVCVWVCVCVSVCVRVWVPGGNRGLCYKQRDRNWPN